MLVPISLYDVYVNVAFCMHTCVFLFQSIVLHCVTVSERYYDSVDYFDYLERKEEKKLINNDRRPYGKV